MIPFTDMTGLASSAISMAAMTAMLPGVVRLQRLYFALLICAIVVAVLIPIGGLPPATYVRGVTGDLSVTSLVLLLMSILHPLCGWTPGGKFNTPSPGMLESSGEKGRYAVLLLIAIAACVLYPMALGIGFFDPYQLGYGNPLLLGGLLLLALAACFKRLPAIALAISLAVFAWGMGWYESTNLWDYLLDPLVSIYAIIGVMRYSIRSYWGKA